MNWGNKLLLTFIAFGAGMFYLVYRSATTNYEMAEKDYYKTELAYQQVIDGTKEANQLSTAVSLTQSEEGIKLQLPQEMKNKTLSGEVWFYCAYDEKRDKKFVLKSDAEAVQLFPSKEIKPGRYTVKINWTDGDKKYYTEKNAEVH
jgi:predicted DNA-binding protein (MmcQ/YjbR family)